MIKKTTVKSLSIAALFFVFFSLSSLIPSDVLAEIKCFNKPVNGQNSLSCDQSCASAFFGSTCVEETTYRYCCEVSKEDDVVIEGECLSPGESCSGQSYFDTSCPITETRCSSFSNKNDAEEGTSTEKYKAGNEVDKGILDQLNPLRSAATEDGGESEYADQLSTPGGILSRFLGTFAFPLAGLVLFVMLVWGGMEMLAGSATKKSIDAGKQRVTAALIGFFLLFASYWIAQILEAMFGIVIL